MIVRTGLLEAASPNGIDEGFVELDPMERFGRYDDLLDQGDVKRVYKAFDQLTGKEVAWNQLLLEKSNTDPELIQRVLNIQSFLTPITSTYIINSHFFWIDAEKNRFDFITEISGGNLREYRKNHPHVSLCAIKKWAKQILKGLEFLHTRKPCIIHRDLNCSNIFIFGNTGKVKIGNFDVAAVGKNNHAVVGTPEYMAPEMYKENYSELVDIYSFGMCLLELVTMEIPYSECDSAEKIYKKVTKGERPKALSRVTDPIVKAFIMRCIGQARPSASDLLKDGFFSDPNLNTKPSSN